MQIKQLILVGLGGATGSILRYILQRVLTGLFPHAFPVGTFAVNIIGCFLIGLFYGWSERYAGISPEMRLLLMTGFCGGFTTFSAFTLEGMNLLSEQRFTIFFLYFALSVLLGLAATIAGAYISDSLNFHKT